MLRSGAMDGWEATRRIKANPRTANIPIIALTAHALATDRDKSVEVGCSDFDTKPVDLLRLLGKIEKCLAKKKIMDSRPNPGDGAPTGATICLASETGCATCVRAGRGRER